jgi:hypothetical protein
MTIPSKILEGIALPESRFELPRLEATSSFPRPARGIDMLNLAPPARPAAADEMMARLIHEQVQTYSLRLTAAVTELAVVLVETGSDLGIVVEEREQKLDLDTYRAAHFFEARVRPSVVVPAGTVAWHRVAEFTEEDPA